MERTILALAVGVTVTCATAAHAQTSEYFLMTGDQAMFHVVQGGVIVRSWPVPLGTHDYQYPIAVMDTIRTTGAEVGEVGGEYDLNGILLGPRYIHPAGTERSWDGTTDGESNYAIGNDGVIHRFDRTWNNPVALFDAGARGGLTYDPTTDSLWVSQSSTTVVTNYTFGGVVIGSFSTGHDRNMALALDHADQTLWLLDQNERGTIEQWTKTGTRLQRIPVPGMSTQNVLGGEFALGDGCVCPEDIDRDGRVGFGDILRILGAWGPCNECDTPGTCGDWTECDGEGCICMTAFDGSGLCIASGTPCGDECPDGTCPPGFVCVRDTCCGPTTCVPAGAGCATDAMPLSPAGTRVIDGVIGPDGGAVPGGWQPPSFGMLSATGPWRPAGPGVSEIGPFAGDFTESWEHFLHYVENPDRYEASPATIFGGMAQISNGFMAVYDPGEAAFLLGSSGVAQVADGTQGMGLDGVGQMATIIFEEPALTFGAYWGAGTDTGGSGDPSFVEALFFDGNGNLIDIAPFTYSRTGQGGDGVLEWHGWESTVPIERIEYVGTYVVVDGMQANSADPCRRRACPEDIDRDGRVGFSDVLEVLGAWGPCNGS